MLKNSSPLKQLDQMEPSLAGSIYVRSKPGIDGPWVCPFQNCVWQPHPRMILKQISKGDNHYLKKQQPSWMEGGAVRHNFERDTPREPLCQVWTPLLETTATGSLSYAVEPIVFLHQTRFIMKGPRLFRLYFEYNTCYWFLRAFLFFK
jgi:hypothetical protein